MACWAKRDKRCAVTTRHGGASLGDAGTEEMGVFLAKLGG